MKSAPAQITKLLAVCIALVAWIAVILQYDLMMAHRTVSSIETTIRFFSFFTILTNSLVALYFSYLSYKFLIKKKTAQGSLSTLTAITVYITIVGLVYQVILRQTWNPTGTQKIVDELLHSAIPILVIIYWVIIPKKGLLSYRQIPYFLIYPLAYLIYVLIRGYYSNFYPYPFLDVARLSLGMVAFNIIAFTLFFALISILFIRISRLKMGSQTTK